MTSTRAPAARPASRTPRQPASPGGRVRRWRGSPPLTLLAVAMGVMMVGLDGTIVAVANPVGLDYWIWPGQPGGLGSSLSDLLDRLPACALSA